MWILFLYFSFLIERMNYYDIVLKKHFVSLNLPNNVFGKN